jgi:hypothetical protein
VIKSVTDVTRATLAVLAVWLVAPGAGADEPAAERLFREGRELMLEHRYAEACPKFQQSQELEPRLGTLLNLAVCHEEEGKVASAWVEYQQALTTARTEGDAKRERLARERIASATPRVPWLTIEISQQAPDTLEIELDGSRLSPELWRREMPVDPGAHRLVVTLPKRIVIDRRFELAEGEREVVRVPLPSEQPSAEPPPAKPRLQAPARGVPTPKPKPSRIGPWVIELGLFAGLVVTDYDHLTPASEGSIALRERASGTPSSCAEVECSYALEGEVAVALGIHAFGGYALSNELVLGARALAGPRLGGGSVMAFGPAATLHAGGQFWLGGTLLLGDVTASGTGRATPPSAYDEVGSGVYEMNGKLAGAFGPMLHADLIIHQTERGAVVASAMPFVIFGSQGNAWALPLAVGYRFQ